MKRAELVFKCVKGFMMEIATYGGAEALTIQFLVPLVSSCFISYNLNFILKNISRNKSEKGLRIYK